MEKQQDPRATPSRYIVILSIKLNTYNNTKNHETNRFSISNFLVALLRPPQTLPRLYVIFQGPPYSGELSGLNKPVRP